jgi:hypothetical protein
MRIDQASGRCEFVASSSGHCARVVTFDKMLDPGLYAVVPFSLQQHSAADPQLRISVLCESDRAAQVPWDDVVPEHVPWNRVLYRFLWNDLAHITVHNSPPWTWRSWMNGTLRFELVAMADGVPSECTVDSTKSHGVISVPSGNRTVQLPARGRAVAIATSVLFHDGSYSYSFQAGWQFKTKPCAPLAGLFGGGGGGGGSGGGSRVFDPFVD